MRGLAEQAQEQQTGQMEPPCNCRRSQCLKLCVHRRLGRRHTRAALVSCVGAHASFPSARAALPPLASPGIANASRWAARARRSATA